MPEEWETLEYAQRKGLELAAKAHDLERELAIYKNVVCSLLDLLKAKGFVHIPEAIERLLNDARTRALEETRSEARAWCRKAGLMEGRVKAAEGKLDKARFEREEIQERLDHTKQKLTECRERLREAVRFMRPDAHGVNSLARLFRFHGTHGRIMPNGDIGDCDCEGCRFLDRLLCNL